MPGREGGRDAGDGGGLHPRGPDRAGRSARVTDQDRPCETGRLEQDSLEQDSREPYREINRLIDEASASARASQDRGDGRAAGEHRKRRRALVRLRNRTKKREEEAEKRALRELRDQPPTEEELLANPLAFPRARSLHLTHGAKMHACVFCDAPFKRKTKQPRFCDDRCRRAALRWRRKLRERLICEGFLAGRSDRDIAEEVGLTVNVVRQKRLQLGLLRPLPEPLRRYWEGGE